MLYNDKVQNRISLDHHTGKIPRTQPQSSTGLIADIIKREREKEIQNRSTHSKVSQLSVSVYNQSSSWGYKQNGSPYKPSAPVY